MQLMYILSILMSDVSLVQAVREVYEVGPARRWSETESRMNKIVVIGKTPSYYFIVCHFFILFESLYAECHRSQFGYQCSSRVT
jgi:hypothetical protein